MHFYRTYTFEQYFCYYFQKTKNKYKIKTYVFSVNFHWKSTTFNCLSNHLACSCAMRTKIHFRFIEKVKLTKPIWQVLYLNHIYSLIIFFLLRFWQYIFCRRNELLFHVPCSWLKRYLMALKRQQQKCHTNTHHYKYININIKFYKK